MEKKFYNTHQTGIMVHDTWDACENQHSVKFAQPAPTCRQEFLHPRGATSFYVLREPVPGHYRRMTRKIHNNFLMTNVLNFFLYFFLGLIIIREKLSKKGIIIIFSWDTYF